MELNSPKTMMILSQSAVEVKMSSKYLERTSSQLGSSPNSRKDSTVLIMAICLEK